jgi:mannose-6-phosphate isomerase-like protein (cupin superfamily)
MATVIPFEERKFSPTATLFQGGEELGVSIFVTNYPQRGQGPQLHLHPYPEVFVVHAGTAKFTVGDEQLVVDAGHIVIAPAETPHAFECAGDDTLRVVSVHPRSAVQQTDL